MIQWNIKGLCLKASISCGYQAIHQVLSGIGWMTVGSTFIVAGGYGIGSMAVGSTFVVGGGIGNMAIGSTFKVG